MRTWDSDLTKGRFRPHPEEPEMLRWTPRGLRVRTAVRWVAGVIFFVAIVAATTHRYGIS